MRFVIAVVYEVIKTVEISRGCFNIGYPSETHLKLKSHENYFANNLFLNWQMVFKFCTKHDRTTPVLYARFLTHSTIKMFFMDERDKAKISDYDEFRADILYCNSPWA